MAPTMGFARLAPETFTQICDYLPDKDLASLSITCKVLNAVVTPVLYSRDMAGSRQSLLWGAANGNVGTIEKALKSGLNIDPSEPFFSKLDSDFSKKKDQRTAHDLIRAAEIAGAMYLGSRKPPVDMPRYKAFQKRFPDLAQRENEDPEWCPFLAWDIICSEWKTVWCLIGFYNHWTALHLAAKGGHIEAIRILLRHGASSRTTSQRLCHCSPPQKNMHWRRTRFNSGWTPLHTALCHGHHDAAHVLAEAETQTPLAHLPVNSLNEVATDIIGPVGIHAAALAGNISILKIYLNSQQPSRTNLLDFTGLQMAAEEARYRELGYSPLSYAIRGDRWDAVDVLVRGGADINFAENGYQLLWRYCSDGEFEKARRLVGLGANVSGTNTSPYFTPPLRSAIKGDKVFARELVAAGADVRDFIGAGGQLSSRNLPLCVAANEDDLAMTKFLLDNGAIVDDLGPTDFHQDPPTKTLGFLMDLGYRPSGTDEFGYTVLHCLAESEMSDTKAKLGERLIQAGEDPKAFVDSNKYNGMLDNHWDYDDYYYSDDEEDENGNALPEVPSFAPNTILLALSARDTEMFKMLEEYGGADVYSVLSEKRPRYLCGMFKCLVRLTDGPGGVGCLSTDLCKAALNHDERRWLIQEPRFIEHAIKRGAWDLVKAMVQQGADENGVSSEPFLDQSMVNSRGASPVQMLVSRALCPSIRPRANLEEGKKSINGVLEAMFAMGADANFPGKPRRIPPPDVMNYYPYEYLDDSEEEPDMEIPHGRVPHSDGSALRMTVLGFHDPMACSLAQTCLEAGGGNPHVYEAGGITDSLGTHTIFHEFLWFSKHKGEMAMQTRRNPLHRRFGDMLTVLLRYPLDKVDRDLVEQYYTLAQEDVAGRWLGPLAEACRKVLNEPVYGDVDSFLLN
ncbi:hypothetical protein MKZ38_009098 [Zalerion maritima]|uniref:F-box domain-containing protein n=1 Tax=Zalerion maritima TaxID=339359 RepID=A0AAD5WV99_9PEZI|nr:hypothetical protein MKZ38_009098 [Zalerion maritima]